VRKSSRALLAHFTLLLLLCFALVWLVRWMPVAEKIKSVQALVSQKPMLGASLHPLLFGLCNILLLPGGILAIGAGMFFGVWQGCLLNLLGSAIASVVAVSIGRTFGRTYVEKIVLKSPRWRALDTAIAQHGGRLIFLTQLHPLAPSSLLNYLYGAAKIPVWQCVAWTALGQTPGLLLYAYIGSLSKNGLNASLSLPQWGGSIAILVVSSIWLAAIGQSCGKILKVCGAEFVEKS
jgi:uncharacterized membrane protein YdjX (TVP38/TMEM64 family)